MGFPTDRSFHVGWVFIGYLMIFGGVPLAIVLLSLLGITSEWGLYLIVGLGALLGGFFTGRASPHISITEPAIGAVLMVVTIFLFFVVTPLGRLIFALADESITKTGALMAATSLGGAMGGAFLGEWSAKSGKPPSWAIWIWYSTLITMGALVASTTFFSLVLLSGSGPEDKDAIGVAVLVALAVAALIGGLVSQLAAARRILLPASLGTLFTGLAIVVLLISKDVEGDPIIGTIAFSVAGMVIALAGAGIGWAVVRNRV